MTRHDVGAVLARAEERLRAEGLTGARAFEALVGALRARTGEAIDAHPVASRAIAALPDEDVDLLGLAYERFFSDLFKGRRGQFFTPRPIVDLLLAVAEVGPGDVVLDPTCGSGGFLVQAARRGATVRGIERDPALVALATLNLRLAGLEGAVRAGDFFAAEAEPVDVVVANPPFSVAIDDPAVLARYRLGRGRRRVASDALFVEALAGWVRPGGRAAVVLPFSLLANPSAAPLRDAIDAAFVRVAVAALPEGVFRPFGGAAGRACLLWLRRRAAGTTPGPVRWAEVADPGYDVRSRRWKPTRSDTLARLAAGDGWTLLPAGAWRPSPAARRGRPVRELARIVEAAAITPDGEVALLELADVDKATGEAAPRRVAGEALGGPKLALEDGDVLVSRLRPALGNVALARLPAGFDGPLLGSAEWVPLRAPALRHFLWRALRTPAWRDALPTDRGQTRPRTTAAAIADAVVPWPGDAAAARIDTLAARLEAERAGARARLDALQQAIDRFADDGDVAALDAAVAALADEDAVRATLAAQVDAWNRGDLDAFCALYTEDCVYVAASGAVRGRDALRDGYRARYGDGGGLGVLSVDVTDVDCRGDVATVVVAWSLRAAATHGGRALLVLARTPDGWRVARDATVG